MAINIEADPIQVLEVTVVGKEYKVRPPKAATLMDVTSGMSDKDEDDMSMDDLNKFVDLLFAPTDSKAVKKRLLDANDSLDLGHVMELLNKVMEEVQPNPTTS